ncbi:NAD-dependent epimerase/dehydratase family protein [Marinilabiliaceae bacterium JC017]|nr:NAD-dependent epimerase/dehydratase family protein [Marinilabiliaceae bacterium JC017]
MILVTGGTGLVGSHLLYKLLEKGLSVKALCRPESNTDQVKKVFSFYGHNAIKLANRINWITADLLDYYSLSDALKDVTQVYHCGAMVSFNPKDAQVMYRINVEGTANLINACIEKKINKFCYVSSIATLGSTINGKPIDEETTWQADDNHSVYSQSKFRAEMEVWRGTKEGLKAVVVNPSVIIGPGEITRSSGLLFQSVRNGMNYYTSGITGFVDVRDVVKAMIMLMESGIANDRFLLNAENMSYQQFFTAVAKALNATPPKKEATPYMTSLAWRFEKIKYWLTGKAPRISKETAKTAHKKSHYSSKKIIDQMGFEFTPIEKTIEETGSFLNNNYRKL